MVKGLFTSSEGMIPLMAKQDQIANNLANINTTGYKKSKLLVKTFTRFLQDDLNRPFANDRITIDEMKIDFSPGEMSQTENPLDLAIEGEGFFLIDTPQGQRFTRNGNFSVNGDGYLVTSEGNLVVGTANSSEERRIKIDGKSINVLSDGTIKVDGNDAGRLRIVTFNEPYPLNRQGDSLFKLHSNNTRIFPAEDFKLHQGYLETSNADPIESMVEMIAIFRNYEANQKAIWAQNETLGKAVNDVGRING